MFKFFIILLLSPGLFYIIFQSLIISITLITNKIYTVSTQFRKVSTKVISIYCYALQGVLISSFCRSISDIPLTVSYILGYVGCIWAVNLTLNTKEKQLEIIDKKEYLILWDYTHWKIMPYTNTENTIVLSFLIYTFYPFIGSIFFGLDNWLINKII